MNMENKPRVSKWILGGYLLLAIMVSGIFITLALVIPFRSSIGFELFCLLTIVVVALVCAAPYSLYTTRYVINKGKLSSRSIFASIDIDKKDIAKVEQTRIPFMFRGFGAGVQSGGFYIPGIGWTKVIMTNLIDGVLLKTKDNKNYLITPSNPKGFVKLLK